MSISPSTSSETNQWSPSSWRKRAAKQQPVYKDEEKKAKALEKLETLPPLVMPSEVDRFELI